VNGVQEAGLPVPARSVLMKKLIVGLVALLPLGALAQKVPDRPQFEPACKALVVGSRPGIPNSVGTAAPKFSAVKIQDLHFTLVLRPNQKPFELAELRLFTPSGGLYQSILVPVGLEAERDRTLPGHPHPVRVQPRSVVEYEGAAHSAISWPPFLVAGTSIVHGSLYGTWRAEARIGSGDAPALSDTVPCATRSFFIAQ